MKKYKWSIKNNAFFPTEMINEYMASGWDLKDAIDVSEDIFAKFQIPPLGKVRSSNAEGMPCWIDAPTPTKEESIIIAEQRKTREISEANTAIAPLQDAVDFDIATDKETEQLKDWRKYRILLNRIDTLSAPDINWPSKPE